MLLRSVSRMRSMAELERVKERLGLEGDASLEQVFLKIDELASTRSSSPENNNQNVAADTHTLLSEFKPSLPTFTGDIKEKSAF